MHDTSRTSQTLCGVGPLVSAKRNRSYQATTQSPEGETAPPSSLRLYGKSLSVTHSVAAYDTLFQSLIDRRPGGAITQEIAYLS